MRELNRKEGAMVSGGTKTLPKIFVIATRYPGPANVGIAAFFPNPGTPALTGMGTGEPGGGGSSYVGKTTTGTHSVDSRCFTSKNGSNNPGDIMKGKFTTRHGATGVKTNGTVIFTTEQQGRYALASLLDGDYGNDSISTFATNYTPKNPKYPNQTNNETMNVEKYMTTHGYTNFAGSINSMNNAEFNTFLDAITKAEGVTNMKKC